ncbi:MAG: sigma-70 family RNA polymerase sigma factor, partial [Planctomycetes bacterium]|nr:sigma-70 family RNA polymerase sigma factor [Planctomycetota bacterium]
LLRHTAWVRRLAGALVRDPAAADDVAQQALTVALERRPALQGPAHLRGWLAGVLRTLARKGRTDARERRLRELAAARPEADDAERHARDRLLLHHRLTAALLALPEPYRSVVTLRYLDGMPPRAIARQRGLRADAVRQQASRGLAMLRQRLDREFGDRGSWLPAVAGLALTGSTSCMLLLGGLAVKKVVAVVAIALVAAAVWRAYPSPPPLPLREREVALEPAGERSVVAAAPAPSRTAVDTTDANAEARRALTERDFTLRVIDPSGAAVPGCALHLWRQGTDGATQRTTDAFGTARFAADDDGGGVLLITPARPPQFALFDSLTGSRELALQDGATFSATILVDGAVAPAGLEFALAVPVAIPAAVPPAVARLAATLERPTRARTDERGRIEFTGIPRDWRDQLRAPQTHWFVPGPDQRVDAGVGFHLLRFAAPQRDLVLHTTRLPCVTGRVVWDDTGEPIAEVFLTATAWLVDHSTSGMIAVHADGEGRFRVGITPESSSRELAWTEPDQRRPIARVEVAVDAPGGVGPTTIEVGGDVVRAGEIVVRVRRAAVRHYEVRDAGNEPIAGALLSLDSATATDARGRGTFAGELGEALVGAAGRWTCRAVPRAPASGSNEDPFVFELQPINRLELTFRHANGAPVEGLRGGLCADGWIFVSERSQDEFDLRFGGDMVDCGMGWRTLPDGSRTDIRTTAMATLGPDGRLTLQSLTPGTTARAVVHDAMRREIAGTVVELPGAGESRSVEVVVPIEPGRVTGFLVDAEGRPLADAAIELTDGGAKARARTDADGRFSIAHLYTPGPFGLRVRRSGFACARRDGVLRGDHVELRLQPGRRVTVHVVDGDDRPVPVAAQAEGTDCEIQELPEGVTILDGLPAGELTFSARIGHRRFEVQGAADQDVVVLRVDRPAKVVVSDALQRDVVADTYLAARFECVDEPGSEPVVVYLDDATESQLLVPGRYRAMLVRTASDGEPEPIGVPQVIALRAGEEHRLDLR